MSRSKFNQTTGKYLYMPIIEDDGKYYYGAAIFFTRPTKAMEVPFCQLKKQREIQPEYYKANGITTKD